MKKYGTIIMSTMLAVALLAGCTPNNTTSTASTITTVDENVYYLDGESDISGNLSSTDTSAVNSTGEGSPSDSATPNGQSPSSSSGGRTSSHAAGTSSRGSTTNPDPEPEEEFRLSNNNIEWYGRYVQNSDSTYSFDWSGTTVQAGFNGTELAVTLSCKPGETGAMNDYMAYSIDGGRFQKLTLRANRTQTYQLAENLSNGYHYVTLVKCTEGAQGTVVTFHGFDYLSSRSDKAPARPTRSIEFIGDSITAGYGTEAAPNTNGFRLDQESFLDTYAYLTANALDASWSCTAISGAGMFQDLNGGGLIIPSYYDRAVYSDASSKWNFSSAPDVVVINLGTNDFARGTSVVDTNAFINAYHAFLDRVCSHYPDAYIVCAIGPMEPSAGYAATHVKSVVEQRNADGDNKVSFCRLELDTTSTLWGADGHPSAAGHRSMYIALYSHIKKVTGWN